MTALQNIPAIGIFNPGTYEVNVGGASAPLAEAGLDDSPMYAKPAHYRAAQLLERRSKRPASTSGLGLVLAIGPG
jgi:hypothetical protein